MFGLNSAKLDGVKFLLPLNDVAHDDELISLLQKTPGKKKFLRFLHGLIRCISERHDEGENPPVKGEIAGCHFGRSDCINRGVFGAQIAGVVRHITLSGEYGQIGMGE